MENGNLKRKQMLTVLQHGYLLLKHSPKSLKMKRKIYQNKYRPNGWNIQQITAHCLDSHINSYIRFKLALTEENPIIKPYNEVQWANLHDSLDYKITDILQLIVLIHKRWVFLLKGLTDKQFMRTFIHPDENESVTLKDNLSIYAWHCNHHLQHIINAKKFQY